ncbi:MAG: hypothetical protein ACKV19_10845 [Verrucomicrobiales bacterium]
MFERFVDFTRQQVEQGVHRLRPERSHFAQSMSRYERYVGVGMGQCFDSVRHGLRARDRGQRIAGGRRDFRVFVAEQGNEFLGRTGVPSF